MVAILYGPRLRMLTHALSAILTARPSLPFVPRTVVEAVLLSEGSIGSADAVARGLGLRNRFMLARLLKREGLPPLHRLAEWATVLSWVLSAERRGVSLCQIAFHSRRHPSACYRLIEEVAGLRWKEVRARGSAWVERQLVEEVRRSKRWGRSGFTRSTPGGLL